MHINPCAPTPRYVEMETHTSTHIRTLAPAKSPVCGSHVSAERGLGSLEISGCEAVYEMRN